MSILHYFRVDGSSSVIQVTSLRLSWKGTRYQAATVKFGARFGIRFDSTLSSIILFLLTSRTENIGVTISIITHGVVTWNRHPQKYGSRTLTWNTSPLELWCTLRHSLWLSTSWNHRLSSYFNYHGAVTNTPSQPPAFTQFLRTVLSWEPVVYRTCNHRYPTWIL